MGGPVRSRRDRRRYRGPGQDRAIRCVVSSPLKRSRARL
jgi:hypothetical protein